MADAARHIVLKDLFHAGGDLGNIEWLPFHDGVEIHRLYGGEDDSACAAFLRYQPGAQIPDHQHTGFEHIIVLSGSQSDHYGDYPAGTLLINAPGSAHAVTSHHGCIVLAIWEKPVAVQIQGP